MDAGKFTFFTFLLPLLPGLVTSGKLLMFLIDGFRWDYTNIHGPLDKLPGFKRVIDSGVKAEYMQSSYPTDSMTNYYGLSTGRYPESNGMIANHMYDRERDAYLHLFELPNLRWKFWWDGAEPIWINAEKHVRRLVNAIKPEDLLPYIKKMEHSNIEVMRSKIKSKPAYMYYWEGCEIERQGINASFCIPYEEPPWAIIKESVRTGIQALKNDTAQLIGVYTPHVDNLGHEHGPFSTYVNQAVKAMNDIISFAMDELQNQRLIDDVDVMVFSDHGMTEASPDRVINVTQLLNTDDVKITVTQGPYVQIWPKSGKVEEVYRSLSGIHPHARAYLKADLPERWHIKNHHRTPDIWLMADVGWTIIYNTQVDINRPGRHGYDNNEPDMSGMFMASGPHFRNGLKTGAIRVVDVYQLMCHVLDVEPQANNGTWSKVHPMLRGVRASGVSNPCGLLALVVCVFLGWRAVIMSSDNIA